MDSASNREIILDSLKRFAIKPEGPVKSELVKTKIDDLDALYESFAQGVTAAGGTVHRVKDMKEALEALDTILKELEVSTVVISEDKMIKLVGIKDYLKGKDIKILAISKDPARHKKTCFSADAGITGADYALADTGTIMIYHGKDNARLISLAPPTHIAFVEADKLLPDIDTLIAEIKPSNKSMPSAMTLITGPSLTADIALQPTFGMHGPKNLYVIFI
ncbi:MAG: lactate utilization protein [Deltaproteobacteria bacterium]|nr:lactate utilization protein [Deltaproteobacteria bacterium]